MENNELRLRAFAAHMPCIVVADTMEWALYGVNHWDNELLLLIDDIIDSYPSDEHHQLLLTDLAEITDEDAVEVWRIVNGMPIDAAQRYDTVNISKEGHRYVKAIINDDPFIRYEYPRFAEAEQHKSILSDETPQTIIAIYDYLRSKGYNLPFMGYDLVKEGIVILKAQ